MAAEGARGQEREFKLGIADEPTFRALIERAGGRCDPPKAQENHFFDTADAGLRSLRLGLRIRHEADGYILTLKGPARTGGDPRLSVRSELETHIDPTRARAVIEGTLPVTALLDALEPLAAHTGLEALLESVRTAARQAPLHLLGSFRNQRTCVHTTLEAAAGPVSVLLEFDRTEFGPGDERFEVELELADDAHGAEIGHALEALFASVGATPTPTSSKLSVFLSRLDREARS